MRLLVGCRIVPVFIDRLQRGLPISPTVTPMKSQYRRGSNGSKFSMNWGEKRYTDEKKKDTSILNKKGESVGAMTATFGEAYLS